MEKQNEKQEFTKQDIHDVLEKRMPKKRMASIYLQLFGEPLPMPSGKLPVRERIAYELQRRVNYAKNREPDIVRQRREAINAHFSQADMDPDPEPIQDADITDTQAMAETATAEPVVIMKKRTKVKSEPRRDPRLPEPGTILERQYGETLIRIRINEGRSVDILDEYDDVIKNVKTVTAAARYYCQCQVNGYRFFNIGNFARDKETKK